MRTLSLLAAFLLNARVLEWQVTLAVTIRLVLSSRGFGYHVDNTTGIATGNEEESIYAVMSGKNFNGGCCFVS